jgi:hypothetical protein
MAIGRSQEIRHSRKKKDRAGGADHNLFRI